jgi:hypothetical protein
MSEPIVTEWESPDLRYRKTVRISSEGRTVWLEVFDDCGSTGIEIGRGDLADIGDQIDKHLENDDDARNPTNQSKIQKRHER